MRVSEMAVSQNVPAPFCSTGPLRRNAPGNAKRTWEVQQPTTTTTLFFFLSSSTSSFSSPFSYFSLLVFITFFPLTSVSSPKSPMFNSPCCFEAKVWKGAKGGPERNRPHPHRLRFFFDSSPYSSSSSVFEGNFKKIYHR